MSPRIDPDESWDYEQDELLIAARDESPTPSYGEIARRLTAKFGIHRTHAACIGRFDRIMKESEAALLAAQVHVRRKTAADRIREAGDPYHPLPEWFKEPSPRANYASQVEASRDKFDDLAREIIVDRAISRTTRVQIWSEEAKEARKKRRENESEEAAQVRRAADKERHRQVREREKARYEAQADRQAAFKACREERAKAKAVAAGVNPLAKEHRQPQRAVGLERHVAEHMASEPVVAEPKAPTSRHYRPSWTD